jgi:hypothetical protein
MTQPPPIYRQNLNESNPVTCEVCGKHRGGRPGSHAKCSKIRQQRGFKDD